MQEQELKNLFVKIKKGIATDAERAFIENWYLQHKEMDGAEYLLNERIQDAEAIWSNLQPLENNHTQRKLWPRIAAAASVLFILSIGTYFLIHTEHASMQPVAQVSHDVTPGSNSATLTLANGQNIQLTSTPAGQIAVQGNMVISKTVTGQLQYQPSNLGNDVAMSNTMTTHRREQYKVVLSDGTNVWLNAASSITYPAEFSGKERKVSITGEAYFEVAHNAKKPFRVIFKGQTVEVLGTHFNVNAYTDEPNIQTTLLQGSVKVSSNHAAVIIKPGQQAAFNDGKLTVNEANTEETVAWKNGYFRFNQEKIESIMRKLSRWYDIDVRFEGPISDDEFSGTVSRSKNISEVLKALEYYNTVHFKIEGRRVTVLR